MSKLDITSIGLSVTPETIKCGQKQRVAIEINARNAAGNDPGPAGVIAAGLCFLTGLVMRWTPNGGPSEMIYNRGKGGTAVEWLDAKHTMVKPGTGPNPGYTDDAPTGFNMGVTKWLSENGFGQMLAEKTAVPGILEIKGQLFESADAEEPYLETPTHTVTVVA